jgi:hypothetical protein
LQLTGQPAQSPTQNAGGGTFTTFDVPGSGSNPLSPNPTAINPAGAITGDYFDADNLIHSFLRTPDGAVNTFDPPGATCGVSTQNACSRPAGINPAGVITGGYSENNGFHGFLRAPNGTFTTFDPPGGSAPNFTIPSGINPAGTVAGSYAGTGFLFHGFLRLSNGVYTTFDPPGSNDIFANGINPGGSITGYYSDADNLTHGFVRSVNGNIVTFDSPVGTFFTPFPPLSPAINGAGVVTGSYGDAIGPTGNIHGFLRAPDGTFTTIDAPGDNYGTFVTGVDSAGDITGFYIPADFSAQHGFVRTRQGTFITFDPPGSGYTTPTAINESGTITGVYCDTTDLVCHGFVWTQHP